MEITQKIKQHEQLLYKKIIQKLQQQSIKEFSKTDLKHWSEDFFVSENILLPETTKETITQKIIHSFFGLGPLEPLLSDKKITEIMVNGAKNVFVEKNGQLEKISAEFFDESHLRRVINHIVSQIGRRIDETSPLVDARLADGSRVNAIIPPLSLSGATLTIRKFPENPFTMPDLIERSMLSNEMFEFLKEAVQTQKNIIISGGTGTGKTSLLNALANLIPTKERIITIEDSAEINIKHEHVISLESRPANIEGNGAISIRALLKNSLRMRPDRIVVGEIRGGEAIDMLQAMNTGHKGSLTTVHANAPLETLYRLETMVLMGDVNLPIQAIRPQIIQAVDIILQISRSADGQRKISSISQVIKENFNGDYQIKEIFKFDTNNNLFIKT